jgi:hypothetical protein
MNVLLQVGKRIRTTKHPGRSIANGVMNYISQLTRREPTMAKGRKVKVRVKERTKARVRARIKRRLSFILMGHVSLVPEAKLLFPVAPLGSTVGLMFISYIKSQSRDSRATMTILILLTVSANATVR